MSFGKKEYETVRGAFRRTWDIDPTTQITPSKKLKNRTQRQSVDWRAELEDAEADNRPIEDTNEE